MPYSCYFASTVLMVRPCKFQYNPEAATDNAFSNHCPSSNNSNAIALQEFDRLVNKLREAKIKVLVLEDTTYPEKPDAVFPNNWFSSHRNGTVVIYPMLHPSRRIERRLNDLVNLIRQNGHECKNLIDYSERELQRQFLEGTGSLVFDRMSRHVFAALCHRTDPGLVEIIARELKYEPVLFTSRSSIKDDVCKKIKFICEKTNRTLIELTTEQVEKFAGNSIQLLTEDGRLVTVMSDSAFDALTAEQKEVIGSNGNMIVHCDLAHIENTGGGSARCMLAEIFNC
ncbi:hypothetical protein ACOME3_000271 [Neoechinorhynchus agilis]